MHNTMARPRRAFTRAAFFVTMVFAALALTPGVAFASYCWVCNSVARCLLFPGHCGDYRNMGGFTCANLLPAPKNSHFGRVGDGASLTVNGKTSFVASDALSALAMKWQETNEERGSPAFAKHQHEFLKHFALAFDARDQRVSDSRLLELSRDLRLPIEKPKR